MTARAPIRVRLAHAFEVDRVLSLLARLRLVPFPPRLPIRRARLHAIVPCLLAGITLLGLPSVYAKFMWMEGGGDPAAIYAAEIRAVRTIAWLLFGLAAYLAAHRRLWSDAGSRASVVDLFLLGTAWWVVTFVLYYSVDGTFMFAGGSTPRCYEKGHWRIFDPLFCLVRWAGWRGGGPLGGM